MLGRQKACCGGGVASPTQQKIIESGPFVIGAPTCAHRLKANFTMRVHYFRKC